MQSSPKSVGWPENTGSYGSFDNTPDGTPPGSPKQTGSLRLPRASGSIDRKRRRPRAVQWSRSREALVFQSKSDAICDRERERRSRSFAASEDGQGDDDYVPVFDDANGTEPTIQRVMYSPRLDAEEERPYGVLKIEAIVRNQSKARLIFIYNTVSTRYPPSSHLKQIQHQSSSRTISATSKRIQCCRRLAFSLQ